MSYFARNPSADISVRGAQQPPQETQPPSEESDQPVLEPKLVDTRKCDNCGLTNFRYQNLGAMVARKCKTPGCERVQNGQVANNPKAFPFILAT